MTGAQATLDTGATPRTWSPLKPLSTYDAGEALEAASSHVYRQQHEGKHEQSRYDAMVWREKYTKHGRCKCDKCERQWQRGACDTCGGSGHDPNGDLPSAPGHSP